MIAMTTHQTDIKIARLVAQEILTTCASTRKGGFLEIAQELGHASDSLATTIALRAWDVAARKVGWNPLQRDRTLYYSICLKAAAAIGAIDLPELRA